MKGKRILLVKISIILMACICAYGGSLLSFDTWLKRILLGGILAGFLYSQYMPPIRAYRRDDIEVVYRGFNFKSAIYFMILGAAWIGMYFANQGKIGLFMALSFGLVGIAETMRVIIFDYSKRVVIGLVDLEEPEMGRFTIGHITEGEDRIRIGDENGFFLVKKDFSEDDWQQLLINLESARYIRELGDEVYPDLPDCTPAELRNLRRAP